MNEHALWADLEEVVEVKEAALVGATSIKPELRRHTDSRFSSFAARTLSRARRARVRRVRLVKIAKMTGNPEREVIFSLHFRGAFDRVETHP